MEKKLQKCAVAAFEVPTSVDVAEYEQTLLPVAVAGATARVGKPEPSCCGSPAAESRRSEGIADRVLPVGVDLSCAVRLTQSCTEPALHRQGLHVG